ncbi:MAG: hypothetical protein ACHQRM_04915 [Bacteroidia bacterium]
MENSTDGFSVRPDQNKTISVLGTDYLNRTVPWLRAIAIIGFVLGLYSLGKSLVTWDAMERVASIYPIPGIQYFSPAAAILGLISSYFLLMYAQKLGTFGREGGNLNLRKAFTNQKVYYIWNGILAILYIVLVIGFIFWMATNYASLGRGLRVR